MNYYICEECGQKYCGWAETIICEKCGGKLLKISWQGYYSEKKGVFIEEEV